MCACPKCWFFSGKVPEGRLVLVSRTEQELSLTGQCTEVPSSESSPLPWAPSWGQCGLSDCRLTELLGAFLAWRSRARWLFIPPRNMMSDWPEGCSPGCFCLSQGKSRLCYNGIQNLSVSGFETVQPLTKSIWLACLMSLSWKISTCRLSVSLSI